MSWSSDWSLARCGVAEPRRNVALSLEQPNAMSVENLVGLRARRGDDVSYIRVGEEKLGLHRPVHEGHGSGPPVVLIHGSPLNSQA